MTWEDFKVIAKALKNAQPYDAPYKSFDVLQAEQERWKAAVRSIADTLELNYSNFKRNAFYERIGISMIERTELAAAVEALATAVEKLDRAAKQESDLGYQAVILPVRDEVKKYYKGLYSLVFTGGPEKSL